MAKIVRILQHLCAFILFTVGLIVGIFTGVMTGFFFDEWVNQGFTGKWSLILFGSAITIGCILPFIKLYRKWELKWYWG